MEVVLPQNKVSTCRLAHAYRKAYPCLSCGCRGQLGWQIMGSGRDCVGDVVLGNFHEWTSWPLALPLALSVSCHVPYGRMWSRRSRLRRRRCPGLCPSRYVAVPVGAPGRGVFHGRWRGSVWHVAHVSVSMSCVVCYAYSTRVRHVSDR